MRDQHERTQAVGAWGECRLRAQHWRDDWRLKSLSGLRKTAAAAAFMFFATVASTIALGALAERTTKGRLGVSEYLAMNGVAGVVHAVFGCQPLLVLRPTGPITLFLQKLAELSAAFHLDFFPLLAWTGLFVGVLTAVAALLRAPAHIFRLTGFALDVFACFVCSIYVHDGINGSIGPAAHVNSGGARRTPSCIVARTTMMAALVALGFWLRRFRLFADVALTAATVIVAAASFVVERYVYVERVHVTPHLSPTDRGRGWGDVTYAAADARLVAAAFVSSVFITFFFFFDQNISSLLTQKPELKKGSYYHSSYLAIALFNVAGPAIGLPFVTGSLPHSPQLVAALRETTSGAVHETRYAPFVFYALIFLSGLVCAPAVRALPQAAVDGILVWVGLDGIFETALYSRTLRLLSSDEDPMARRLTFVQLAVLGLAWGLNVAPAGLLFPVVIVALVPIRDKLLPRLIDNIDTLDPHPLAAANGSSASTPDDKNDYQPLHEPSSV